MIEITVPRPTMLELVKTVTRRGRYWDIPRLNTAFTTIANVGAKQGYRAARWLVPADAAWMLAYAADAHTVYGPDIPDDHPALVAQNAVRATLTRDAPTTCRSMRKQWELGDIAVCDHCRGVWSITHTCEGQPEPILQRSAV